MKKILKSLAVIVAVAAIVVGGTIAYFSDTEVSEDNVFTAGTIDIAVNDQNPWEQDAEYVFSGLEPSDDEDINVTLENVGTNDVVVWKKVEVTSETTGLESEPECEEEGGTWDESAAVGSQCSGNTLENNNISSQFVYSMNIGGSTNIDQAWDVRLSDIDGLWIPVGRLNANTSITVDQNYYFDEMAGNEYQGDEMTIDITFYAEQLDAPGPAHTTAGVVLDNKDASNDWAPEVGDGIWGLLTFDGSGDYTIRAWGLEGSSYRVAHYDESTSTQTLMGSVLTPDANGDIASTTDTLGEDGADSKYWLRDLTWDNDNTLWESNLVDN